MVAVVATLVVVPIMYFFLLNSDALRVSRQYARTEPMISELIGKVQFARLVPFDSRLQFRKNDEFARLDLWLIGTRNQAYLIVELKCSDSGPWRVIAAELYPYGASRVTIGISPH